MRINRLWIAPALALALLLAFAAPAAASSRPPHPNAGDCSAYHTIMSGPWQGFTAGGSGSFRIRIEQEYTPGGANCNQWRKVVDISASGGSVTTSLDYSYCLSGGCGYFDTFYNSVTVPSGNTYSFSQGFVDLTSVASGCVWTARAMVNNNTIAVYTSSYICV